LNAILPASYPLDNGHIGKAHNLKSLAIHEILSDLRKLRGSTMIVILKEQEIKIIKTRELLRCFFREDDDCRANK
jgi:hypothetical protein